MTVRERMLHDHEQLERSFKELESVVEGANAPTLVERWTAFERRVKAHFDAEERHLLPRLEDAHPNEVAELLDIPAGTVKSRLRVARESLLRVMIERLGVDAEAWSDEALARGLTKVRDEFQRARKRNGK